MTDDRKDKPGPKPDRLKIEGDWEEAAKRLVRKQKPPEGWPEQEKPKQK